MYNGAPAVVDGAWSRGQTAPTRLLRLVSFVQSARGAWTLLCSCLGRFHGVRFRLELGFLASVG